MLRKAAAGVLAGLDVGLATRTITTTARVQLAPTSTVSAIHLRSTSERKPRSDAGRNTTTTSSDRSDRGRPSSPTRRDASRSDTGRNTTPERGARNTGRNAFSSSRQDVTERKPRADTGRNTKTVERAERGAPSWNSSSGRNDAAPRRASPASAGRDKAPRLRKPGPAPRAEDGSALYPLQPNILSARLKSLVESKGDVEGAITMLKNAPADAQNTAVWNTVIWECMKAGKYQSSYTLFVDMKRRGFKPNIRTFSSMLSGYARKPDFTWKDSQKQLENMHSVYSNLITLLDIIGKQGKIPDNDLEYLSSARASYIKVLGAAGLHQRVFDVYNAMEASGPLAPDRIVFTAVFKALATRKEGTHGSNNSDIDPDDMVARPSQQSAPFQNASDVKLLWRQMLKLFDTNTQRGMGERFSIDSFLLSEALLILARGRPSDQAFGLELISEHLELTVPGEAGSSRDAVLAPLKALPHLLNAHTLNAALSLANETRRFRLTTQFFQQVVDLEETLKAKSRRSTDVHDSIHIIDRGHTEHVLTAWAWIPREAGQALETLRWMLRRVALGDGRVRPEPSTYAHVLVAAWRSQDWNVAAATWELMTGYRVKSFAAGREADAPERERAAPAKTHIDPNPEHISALVKTALATRYNEGVAQTCLRMLEAIHVDKLLSGAAAKEGLVLSRRHKFFLVKLAESMPALVEQAVPFRKQEGSEAGRPSRTEEERRWLALSAKAKESVARLARFLQSREERSESEPKSLSSSSDRRSNRAQSTTEDGSMEEEWGPPAEEVKERRAPKPFGTGLSTRMAERKTERLQGGGRRS